MKLIRLIKISLKNKLMKLKQLNNLYIYLFIQCISLYVTLHDKKYLIKNIR